jgi:hypothetical protein
MEEPKTSFKNESSRKEADTEYGAIELAFYSSSTLEQQSWNFSFPAEEMNEVMTMHMDIFIEKY